MRLDMIQCTDFHVQGDHGNDSGRESERLHCTYLIIGAVRSDHVCQRPFQQAFAVSLGLFVGNL
jgi:hypothetical protein